MLTNPISSGVIYHQVQASACSSANELVIFCELSGFSEISLRPPLCWRAPSPPTLPASSASPFFHWLPFTPVGPLRHGHSIAEVPGSSGVHAKLTSALEQHRDVFFWEAGAGRARAPVSVQHLVVGVGGCGCGLGGWLHTSVGGWLHMSVRSV